jgi:hypothetical protein
MSDRLLKMFSRCFLPIAIRKIVFSVMEIWQLKNYYVLLPFIDALELTVIESSLISNISWKKTRIGFQLI